MATTNTAPSLHRLRTKDVTVGLAAAVLAAGLAYGVAVLAFDGDAGDSGRTTIGGTGAGQTGTLAEHGKPASFPGTDREWRVQLHGR